jgi:ribosomal protein L39E
MSLIERLLDLNRRMAKMAKRPRAIPIWISTDLSRMQTRKIIIPIWKKENTLRSFLEYLK